MTRRILAAALLMVVVILAAASPAGAVGNPLNDPDCKAPVPQMPGRGASSWLVPAPVTPPAPGDPFATKATTTIYTQYAFAGATWHVCDVGNGLLPDIASSAYAGTSFANWVLGFTTTATALTIAVLGVAFDPQSWMGVLYPFASAAISGLADAVFEPAGVVAFALLSIVILWNARKWELGKAMSTAGAAVLILLGICMVVAAPVALIQTLNSVPGRILAAANAGVGGDPTAAGATASSAATATSSDLYRAVIYERWASGMFGDATSDTARRYGPVLWANSAMTWDEAAKYRADPGGAGKTMNEDKQKRYSDAMAELKEKDPDAYEYATGHRSEDRVQDAFLAAGCAVATLPFLLIAAAVIIACYVMVPIGLIWFVCTGVLGIFPQTSRLAIGPLEAVVAAEVNAIALGVGAAVHMVAVRVLLAPTSGIPAWLAILLILVLSAVLGFVLHPVRRAFGMFGVNPPRLWRRRDQQQDRPERMQRREPQGDADEAAPQPSTPPMIQRPAIPTRMPTRPTQPPVRPVPASVPALPSPSAVEAQAS